MVALRPIQSQDEVFLRQVYAASREDELALVNWTAAQKDAFLRMQFDAQHRHYQAHYPAAQFSIVLKDGEPVGRLYLDRGAEEFCLIDIALLPAHRSAGIGTMLLSDILAEAGRAGKPVRIHVERNNRARELYQRLGFQLVEEGPIYLLMRKFPQTSGPRPIG